MEKIHLNSTQTKALKRMKEGFAISPNTLTNGTYIGRLQVAQEFIQCAKETLDYLENSITDAITEVYAKNYGESVEKAESIFDELTMLKEQTKQLEENAARAILAIDQMTDKSNLTWMITDDEILREIKSNYPETQSIYLEHRDKEIYMLFTKTDESLKEIIHREVFIALGAKEDIPEVEQHINEILENNNSTLSS